MSKEKEYKIIVVSSPSPISGGGFRALRSLREYVKYFEAYLFVPWGLWSNKRVLVNSISYLRELRHIGVRLAGTSQLPELLFNLRELFGTRIFERLLPLIAPTIAHLKISTLNCNALVVLHECWDAVYCGSILKDLLGIPSIVLLQLPPFYGSKERFLNILKALRLWRELGSKTSIERILSEIEVTFLNISEHYLCRLRYEGILRKYNIILGISRAIPVEMSGNWLDYVTCLDPGVSLDDEDLETIKRIREKIKEKENYIVFGGRPAADKGLFEALISFKVISKYFPGIKLFVTGGIPPKTFSRIKRICKKLGIEGRVVFTGFIPREERFKIVTKARLMLYPSHVDSFSYAVLEALHLGTPVIAYRIPALEIYYSKTPGVELVDEWCLESFTVKAIDILEKGIEAVEPPKIKSWKEIMDEELRIISKLINRN